jgi:hypothetical protein
VSAAIILFAAAAAFCGRQEGLLFARIQLLLLPAVKDWASSYLVKRAKEQAKQIAQ